MKKSNLNTVTRMVKNAKMRKLQRIHIVNGVAHATDGKTMFIYPTQKENDYSDDFDLAGVCQKLLDTADANTDTRVIVDSHPLLQSCNAVIALHRSRHRTPRKGEKGTPIARVWCNGKMSVAGNNPEVGSTQTDIENRAEWYTKRTAAQKRKGEHPKVTITYQHAGKDADFLVNAGILKKLVLFQECETVTLSLSGNQVTVRGHEDGRVACVALENPMRCGVISNKNWK